MPSSQKLQIWLKPNCTWMFIGWSSTNFTFFVLIWNSKWRLRQDLFNIGPYGKNASKRFFSETKLPRNDHWKVLCFLCRSEIQDGCHHRTISGKYRNIFFSEAIALIEPKLCINHWKVLYKLCVFYVDRNSKMTTTAGHSFYIGPIGFFYNQVNDTGSWEPLVGTRRNHKPAASHW